MSLTSSLNSFHLRCIIALASCHACWSVGWIANQSVRERHAQLTARWIEHAEQVAEEYQAVGNREAADAVRILIQPRATEIISIPVLPTNGEDLPPPSDWEAELKPFRKQHAKALFDLARTAFQAREMTLCYDLVREAIEHDTDHGAARALMGFTRYGDRWVTPYAAAKLRANHIWHSRYGWIPKSQLAKYEQGKQLWKGQWLPREEVAKFRQQWPNAWEIETEHYLVRTNTSLELGVAFAERLEKLYAIFFRLFAGFFNQQEQVALLFDPRRTGVAKGPDAVRRPKRFRVHFYRTRDEYLAALRPHIKTGLEPSTGMYYTGTRTAYFYVHQEMSTATVIHEATHQLFSETREHTQGFGSRGNYWVIEGIACYMESLKYAERHAELGSWETPRLRVGRERIRNGEIVPLERLVQLESKDFDGPEVFTLYTQSACFSHFLMHHDNGRYREALVKYLEEVYLGRADYRTLADLVGVEYEELDRQFREHVLAGKYR